METLTRTLKVVVELERVDRGKPSDIKESRTPAKTGVPRSAAAQRLLESLDRMSEAEDEAGGHLVEPVTNQEEQPN